MAFSLIHSILVTTKNSKKKIVFISATSLLLFLLSFALYSSQIFLPFYCFSLSYIFISPLFHILSLPRFIHTLLFILLFLFLSFFLFFYHQTFTCFFFVTLRIWLCIISINSNLKFDFNFTANNSIEKTPFFKQNIQIYKFIGHGRWRSMTGRNCLQNPVSMTFLSLSLSPCLGFDWCSESVCFESLYRVQKTAQ